MRALRNRVLAAGLALAASALAAVAEPTVVALGDSLTAGYGLPREQGFVPVLQDWLAAHGHDVTVVNAGVSGDTTAGGVSRLDWTLAGPADAMIVNLGGNDLLRGLDPAQTRANLDRILAAAKARGLPVLLVGLQAPTNYGPDFKARFDAVFPDLAKSYGTVFVPDYFLPVAPAGARTGLLRDYMQGDGIHPNAKGVRLIVDAVGPKVLELLARIKG